MQLIDRESYTMPKTNKQKERKVDNFDYLVRTDSDYYYPYANGMKTGSTTGALDCLVASATKKDQNLICVVFGVSFSNKSQRWNALGPAANFFECKTSGN